MLCLLILCLTMHWYFSVGDELQTNELEPFVKQCLTPLRKNPPLNFLWDDDTSSSINWFKIEYLKEKTATIFFNSSAIRNFRLPSAYIEHQLRTNSNTTIFSNIDNSFYEDFLRKSVTKHHRRIVVFHRARVNAFGLIVHPTTCEMVRNGGCLYKHKKIYTMQGNPRFFNEVITLGCAAYGTWHFPMEALVALASVPKAILHRSYIHLPELSDYIWKWLDVLDISRKQIIVGDNIEATTLYVPEMGRCGAPFPTQLHWLYEEVGERLWEEVVVKKTRETQVNRRPKQQKELVAMDISNYIYRTRLVYYGYAQPVLSFTSIAGEESRKLYTTSTIATVSSLLCTTPTTTDETVPSYTIANKPIQQQFEDSTAQLQQAPFSQLIQEDTISNNSKSITTTSIHQNLSVTISIPSLESTNTTTNTSHSSFATTHLINDLEGKDNNQHEHIEHYTIPMHTIHMMQSIPETNASIRQPCNNSTHRSQRNLLTQQPQQQETSNRNNHSSGNNEEVRRVQHNSTQHHRARIDDSELSLEQKLRTSAINQLFRNTTRTTRVNLNTMWMREKHYPKGIIIFVNRTRNRKLTNVLEITTWLQQFAKTNDYDFHIHEELIGYDIDAQILLFKQAAMVIGTHGAGLLFTAFVLQSTCVIELMPTAEYPRCYARIAYLRQLLSYEMLLMSSLLSVEERSLQESVQRCHQIRSGTK